MLESVDLSRPPLSKEEYKPRRDALMEELVVLQQEAVKKGVGLVVLFEGWNGAGKGSRISDPVSYTHLDVYKRQFTRTAAGTPTSASSSASCAPTRGSSA